MYVYIHVWQGLLGKYTQIGMYFYFSKSYFYLWWFVLVKFFILIYGLEKEEHAEINCLS